jgi:hypothetical protein
MSVIPTTFFNPETIPIPTENRHLSKKPIPIPTDVKNSIPLDSFAHPGKSKEWGCTSGNAATVVHSTKKTNKRKRFRYRRATFTTVYVVGW